MKENLVTLHGEKNLNSTSQFLNPNRTMNQKWQQTALYNYASLLQNQNNDQIRQTSGATGYPEVPAHSITLMRSDKPNNSQRNDSVKPLPRNDHSRISQKLNEETRG